MTGLPSFLKGFVVGLYLALVGGEKKPPPKKKTYSGTVLMPTVKGLAALYYERDDAGRSAVWGDARALEAWVRQTQEGSP